MKAELNGNKVIVKGTELFENGWYGKKVKGNTVLSFIEACLIMERGRIEIAGYPFKKFFEFCSKKDKNFVTKYVVYRDLRERGLPVRMGFKDCDFRVYERGAKKRGEGLKWIVFTTSEDRQCKINVLGRMSKLSKNIRAESLLAVVDNDTDVTYYKVSELLNL